MSSFWLIIEQQYKQSLHKPTCPKHWRSKTGFGLVKIMKEFAWINRFFFLNLAFGQVGERIKAKTTIDKFLIAPAILNGGQGTPYNRLSGQQMLSGTQIISMSHGMTGRNFFDVFLPFYLLFSFWILNLCLICCTTNEKFAYQIWQYRF